MLIRDVLMAIREGDDADIVELRHLDETASDADQGNFWLFEEVMMPTSLR